MRNFFTLSAFLILSICLTAQTYNNNQAKEIIKEADIIRYKEDLKAPSYIKFNKNQMIDFDNFDIFSKSLIKSNNSCFSLEKVQNSKPYIKNSNSKQVYRYIQTLNGYPIEFTTWLVHVENGKIKSMNGEFIEAPEANTNFAISEEYALKKALEYINAEIYMWESENEEKLLKKIFKDDNATYFPKGEKMIVPDKIELAGSTLKAAYKFDISSQMPYNRKEVYVDAQTGEILFDLPLIYNNTSSDGLAHTQYSGTQNITTSYNEEEEFYILEDDTRGSGIMTYNCNNDTVYSNATNFVDNNNIWNEENDTMPKLDRYALDAHFGATATYDYLLNVHNRKSIDDEDYPLISYLNYDLIKYGLGNNINAFWSGRSMVYGKGDTLVGITPLATIDVCGHEISHGLTQKTANLVYRNESGALNEAFSDIFGTAIEFFATPEDANWTIGEKCGMTMRSMSNPKEYKNPDTYKGIYWHSNAETDNGGVHTNSGVLNYWFYLICEGGSGTNDFKNSYNITGLGIQKGEQIAFKLLTEYLTRNSNYKDTYFYAIQATAEIFGECSPEVETVANAFYAVGVASEPYINQVIANFSANVTQHCEVPFKVSFTNLSHNGLDFVWDFGDGNTSTRFNPSHTYEEFGEYTVKLTINSNDCGEDSLTKENYIKFAEDALCIYTMEQYKTTTLEGCEGIVFGPGGINNDSFNEAQSILTLHSPGVDRIEIDFIFFDIESRSETGCGSNYIAFFDGTKTNSPKINSQNYCNNNPVTETIASTGENLTIWFRSGIGSTKSNFQLQYKCFKDNSIETMYSELSNIYVSPNPTDGIINICGTDNLSEYAISIVDITGKTLMDIRNINDNKIDCSNLSNGAYYLRLTSDKEQKTLKFIIQK